MRPVYDLFVVSPEPALAVELLHELVAIPSLTGSESAVLDFLERRFLEGGGWSVESIEVSPGRRNLLVSRGHPPVVLTRHVGTVPPYFPPRRGSSPLFGPLTRAPT